MKHSSYIKHPHWKAYREQRKNAFRRKIPFLISFGEWLDVWEKSGHFESRGVGTGKYCMARFGDAGPYAVYNVKIILTNKNVGEHIPTELCLAKRSIALKGQKRNAIARNNIRLSKLGNKNPMFGKARDFIVRQKISEGMKRYKACVS